MDLQAILDASSSDDDDDYLSKYNNTNNIPLTSTISNLSSNISDSHANYKQQADNNVSSNSYYKDNVAAQRSYNEQQEEVLSGISSSSPPLSGVLHDDDMEEDDDENLLNNDIINSILNNRSPYRQQSSASGDARSGSGANLELEKILREAEENDCDDDSMNDEYNLSPPPPSSSANTNKRHISSSTKDYLLQSILNEDDDNSNDNEEDVISSHRTNSYKKYTTMESTLSNLSISNSSTGQGIARRLSSLTPTRTSSSTIGNEIITSHSFEIDAILNSVQDSDDSDSYEDNHLNVRNYSAHKGSSQQKQRRIYHDDDELSDDSTTERDDGGLNFNFSNSAGNTTSSLYDSGRKTKYDDNISMQYPLSRNTPTRDADKEHYTKGGGYEEKNVYVHHNEYRREQSSSDLKDYTANFLSSVSKSFEEKDNANQGHNNLSPASISSRNNNKTTSPNNKQTIDEENQHTILCLQHAEVTERRLLKSSNYFTRNIISPLTVKRRMKPKVELMTKSRSQQQQNSKQSSGSSSSKQQQWQQPRFGFSGGIIQSKSMSTIGSQLLKSNNHQNTKSTTTTTTGLPTALAVNSKFIAVGNQRGQIYIFDLFQQLKIILCLEDVDTYTGATLDGGNIHSTILSSTGPVTSIDLSLHGDYLLGGYGTGQIILWDVINGSVLKHLVELHTSSVSSVRLTFVPSNNSSGKKKGVGADNEIGAVSVDASGLVNKLTFTRGRLWSSSYSFEYECLLDGTAGQILAMDALSPLDDDNVNVAFHSSVHKIVLIALSSARSSFAVSVEPKVSVLHRWARPTTERIDPSISDEDRLTQVSSSVYASTYASSYASSYMSTSTYHSTDPPPKLSSSSTSNVDNTPVPYLPCLSWGWALVSGGGHTVTPILARAWGCCLQFLRASFPEVDDEYDNEVAASAENDDVVHWPAFGTHDEFDASAPVVALNWLGKRSLVYLTITNEFIVIDTVIMTMQERLDFSGMKLVYAEFALSRQRRLPNSNGCTTFMNSIRSNDNRLLVLCQEEIKEITVLGMRQQILSLEDGGQWLEALALALDHYESTITSQEDNRREDAASSSAALRRLDVMTRVDSSLLTEDEIWMAELLMRYLILAIDNAPDSTPMEYSSFSTSPLPNSRLNLAESHFEMLSGVCLEFCMVTRRLDLLFGPIFRCFYDARYINVFLDIMETYILNDRLKYIAPEAMVLFVSHCKDMKDLSMVERCLLHMDCKLMDFDSILSLLKKNALYTGLFHVYSSGLDDYVSPLEILFDALFEAADSVEDTIADRRKDGIPSNKFEQFGYKIILYLRHCFKGKTFPKGDDILPAERLQTLRPELFDLLFSKTSRRTSQQSRNTSNRGLRALSYPYLRALILIDAKALLDCLAIALDDGSARFAQAASQMHTLGSYDVEYETDNMMIEVVSPAEDEQEVDKELLPDRQDLVNIISSIIMSDSLVGSSSYHYGPRKQMTLLSIKAKHFFLDFLAKYLQLGVITAPKYLTGEVFIRLCNKKGSSENDILALLQALPRSSYELDEVLYTVERVRMTRGALFLHKVGVTKSLDRDDMADKCQHHFNRSIDCYLNDMEEDVKKGVFGYARKECAGGNVSMLRSVVLKRLPELVKLDAVHAAHLVGEIFIEEIDMILSSLQRIESGRVEYSFLHAIISGDLSKQDSVIAQELLANLTVDHHHSYLLLMTTFQPEIVYQYLSSNENYRLNDALKLCQERKITDASAYLLERMGDVSGALKLMLETLDTRMITLKNIIQHSIKSNNHHSSRSKVQSNVHQNDTAQKEIVRIKQILSAVLDLCERNKNDHLTSLDHERGPLLWFHVLDRLVNAKTLLSISKNTTELLSVELSTVLSELLLMTMQRMISNVSLFDLMHKITKDHAGSDLGEFREMLVSMLKTYSSELDVCSKAVDVMYYDIRCMAYEKKKLKVQGSFVQECPKDIPRQSFLDVGAGGQYEVKSPRSVVLDSHLFSVNNQAATHKSNAVSLLKQRRVSNRYQSRSGKRRRGGGTNINLMTSSECQFSPGRVDMNDFGLHRQVGALSEAQNVGGL